MFKWLYFYRQQFSCTVDYSQDGHQSVVDPEEGPFPLTFRPNWGPKVRKKILLSPGSSLISGSGWPPPPLSEGLDPPLHLHTYMQTVSKITCIVFDNSYLCVDDICLSVIIRSYKLFWQLLPSFKWNNCTTLWSILRLQTWTTIPLQSALLWKRIAICTRY